MGEKQLLEILKNLDIDAIGNQLTFKIGEVEFEMERMPGVPAWDLLEELRAETLGSLAMGNIMRLLSIPPQFVREKLIAEIGKHTWFKSPQVKQGKLLFGENMDMAMQAKFGVQPTAMYELIGRFLCINFPNLLRGLVKNVGKIKT